jgi:hypothetical protein
MSKGEGALSPSETVQKTEGIGATNEQPTEHLPVLPRRKRPERCVKVYLTEAEYQRLRRRADQAGLSLSAFTRACGLNLPILHRIDIEALRSLLGVCANLGRFGGLLKMWLASGKGRRDVAQIQITDLLHDILGCRDQLITVADQVRRPERRGEPNEAPNGGAGR